MQSISQNGVPTKKGRCKMNTPTPKTKLGIVKLKFPQNRFCGKWSTKLGRNDLRLFPVLLVTKSPVYSYLPPTSIKASQNLQRPPAVLSIFQTY